MSEHLKDTMRYILLYMLLLILFFRNIIIFSLFIFSVWWIRKRSTHKHPAHLPPLLPHPAGLPFVGNLFHGSVDMRSALRQWSNELGGVFRLRIGPEINMMVVSDLGVMQEAFVDQADTFSEGRREDDSALVDAALEPRVAGDKLQKAKWFGRKVLKTLGLGPKGLEEGIMEEGRRLAKALEMKNDTPFNPKWAINNAVSNVITSLVYGYHYDYNNSLFEIFINNVSQGLKNLRDMIISNLNIMPFIYFTPQYVNFRRSVQNIVVFFKLLAIEPQQTFQPLDVTGLVDNHLVEIKELRGSDKSENITESKQEKSERQLRFVVDVFASRMTNTVDILRWAILLVAQCPELLQQLHNEIDEVVGADRKPKLADRCPMPLTEATLMEVIRFRPVAPLGVPRYTTKDTTLHGYHVPKDTVALMNLWEVLNSPNYWDQPEEFNPYRFLTEDGQCIKNHPTFIPFGIGIRERLSERLVRMELFIFFTCLLRKLTFRVADDTRAMDTENNAGTSCEPPDYKVVFERRIQKSGNVKQKLRRLFRPKEK